MFRTLGFYYILEAYTEKSQTQGLRTHPVAAIISTISSGTTRTISSGTTRTRGQVLTAGLLAPGRVTSETSLTCKKFENMTLVS